MSFYGTTMKDIANAAKISRRTLYTHFNSKEEIFNHIVNQKIELIDQKLEQAVKTVEVIYKGTIQFNRGTHGRQPTDQGNFSAQQQ